MPILINEVYTEVIEAESENSVPNDQASASDISTEWLKMVSLLKERQARLEDD
jgi:hypothetical protein